MNQERILYEDKDIIVCHKAAGIATQTARVGQADMVSEVSNYLKSAPYLGVVHRLDQPVEGILVFAKNKQAASKLSRQITEGCMEKYYYAMVCGWTFKRQDTLTDYLLKDGRSNMSRIVPPEVKDAKKAVLDYEIPEENIFSLEKYMEKVLARKASGNEPVKKASCLGNGTDTNTVIREDAGFKECPEKPRIALAQIRLHTGRHHQIRVQMSQAGMSLLGDYKYADAQTVKISEQMHVKEIALCAYRLIVQHPGTGKRMEFQIQPEGRWFQAAMNW